MDAASPMILIALSYVEGALVDRGYAIEQHPREHLVHEDAWSLSVLSADDVPFCVGIWLDERGGSADLPVYVNPAVRMVTEHDQTLFEVRHTDDDDALVWVDPRDAHALVHALATFRHDLAGRVGHALDLLDHNR
jgi:hypothetical protein